MKFLRILFAIFLFIVFILTILHFVSLKVPTSGAYTILTVSFLSFIAFFGVLFLNVEVGSKIISLKKQVQSLENKSKEVQILAKTSAKLAILSKYQTLSPLEFDKNIEISDRLQEELKQFINDDEINNFIKELDESHNKFSGKTK